MSELLSTTEAAARLGVDPATVRRLCREKRIKARQVGLRSWVIDAADLVGVVIYPKGWQKGRKEQGD